MREVPPGLSAEDARSWQLNAAALVAAADAWERWGPKIRANLATMRRACPSAGAALDRLEALVGDGPAALAAAMLAATAEGQVLRSCSPLAGILPEAERQRVLRATRRVGTEAAPREGMA